MLWFKKSDLILTAHIHDLGNISLSIHLRIKSTCVLNKVAMYVSHVRTCTFPMHQATRELV